MEEPFKPQSLTIKELFGNADAFYKIPQYQRPYRWEEENRQHTEQRAKCYVEREKRRLEAVK